MNRHVLFCCACGALLASGVWAQSTQSSLQKWAIITGQVLDSDNHPVVGASVTFLPLDTGMSGIQPNPAITDKEGRYKLSIPPYPGKTRLCAVKESAGYPDTQSLLFSFPNDKMPVVSLTPGAVLENVEIRLGPPDGVLNASVVDARTGAPVTKGRISLRREDPPSHYSASQYFPDGRFSFALPPVPIYVAFDALGYAHWTYKDPITGNPYLLLPTNSIKAIVVSLIPDASGTP